MVTTLDDTTAAERVSTSFQARAFKLAAFAEAVSWIGLLIGMFFKWIVQSGDLGVRIFGPIHGTIFKRRVAFTGAHLAHADYHRLGLEFEICVRLGQDLLPSEVPFTPEAAGAAVDAVAAAIEIVDDRHADYSVLHCGTLIADNSWNAGVVLGAFTPPPAKMEEATGVAYLDGSEFARGLGADVLGHPYVPLAWLANHLAASGRMLRKGDIVMTGSIVTTRFPTGPFTYRFDVSGIGSVEVSGS